MVKTIENIAKKIFLIMFIITVAYVSFKYILKIDIWIYFIKPMFEQMIEQIKRLFS